MIFQMLANEALLAIVHKGQCVYWCLTAWNRKFPLHLVFLVKPDNRGPSA